MHWVSDRNVALLTDLYELTMVQAYWRERMFDESVFSLFVRTLPPSRNFLVACGIRDALEYLQALRFSDDALGFLARRPEFSEEFLHWLSRLRFRGDVYAVPEGTPIFANEPLLEVVASLPEAQLAESVLINQVHLQTLAASKAARVVHAAQGRHTIDFGLRRMHGADASLKAARAFYAAGVDATSNVLAGQIYGIPVAGTMAHSYVQAHHGEREAFRAFAQHYPDTVLLVDTYDTLDGVQHVIELAGELGEEFRVRGIRLDSGDLATLAVRARAMLDAAGLQGVKILASGGLDEHRIQALVQQGVPIDGFGVGTDLGVSRDAPALDAAYKLTSYAGSGRLKLSPGKQLLAGRKQVFRIERDGTFQKDVIALADEQLAGQPLLRRVMAHGRILAQGGNALDSIRERTQHAIAQLPAALRSLKPAVSTYRVEISPSLEAYQREVLASLSLGPPSTVPMSSPIPSPIRARTCGTSRAHAASGISRQGGDVTLRSVLLVVDIQPDFLPGGALAVREGDRILQPIRKLMESGRFDLQVATQDWHPPDHVSFASNHPGHEVYDVIDLYGHPQVLWPDHCVQDSQGARLHGDLPWRHVSAIIRKGSETEVDSYSTFRNNWNPQGRRPPTGLGGYLRERRVGEIFICGLAREYCVKWSAEDAADMDLSTHVLWDLTRPVDPSSDETTRADLEARGVQILNLRDL